MAQWGTPEYNREQQAMWDRQAAIQRQQQETANIQMRDRQAADKARADSQRKSLDQQAGMLGLRSPMYGNHSEFRAGQNMTGRDYDGKFYSQKNNKLDVHTSTGATNSGQGGGAAIVLILFFIIAFIAITSA